MRFKNRASAGAQLADVVAAEAPDSDIILGVPTGGCVIAREMAITLRLPAFVLITRKIRCPRASELAIGAVAPDGHTIVDDSMVAARRLTADELVEARKRAGTEVGQRLTTYAAHLVQPGDVACRRVLIADDGVATGLTMLAAVLYVTRLGAQRVTVATPVIAPEAAEMLGHHAAVVSVTQPADFRAVGEFYLDFPQLTDAEALASMAGMHAQTPTEEP